MLCQYGLRRMIGSSGYFGSGHGLADCSEAGRTGQGLPCWKIQSGLTVETEKEAIEMDKSEYRLSNGRYMAEVHGHKNNIASAL